MDTILAANDRELAVPEGAANIGENAPLPEVTPFEEASPQALPQEAAYAGTAPDGREWTRKVAQRIKEERSKAQSELISELFGGEEELQAYRERREREQASAADVRDSAMFAELALATHPQLGEHYLALEDEVRDLAEAYDTDVESAFLLVLSQHLPRLLREERQRGEQDLLARISAHAATPGSLADGMASAVGIEALSDADFANMVARVKRGELRQ